jgi:hypothetical protein
MVCYSLGPYPYFARCLPVTLLEKYEIGCMKGESRSGYRFTDYSGPLTSNLFQGPVLSTRPTSNTALSRDLFSLIPSFRSVPGRLPHVHRRHTIVPLPCPTCKRKRKRLMHLPFERARVYSNSRGKQETVTTQGDGLCQIKRSPPTLLERTS